MVGGEPVCGGWPSRTDSGPDQALDGPGGSRGAPEAPIARARRSALRCRRPVVGGHRCKGDSHHDQCRRGQRAPLSDDRGRRPDHRRRFELDARAFLDAAAPKRSAETLVWGRVRSRRALSERRRTGDRRTGRGQVMGPRGVRRRLGWITGPPHYGGRGLPREYQRAYASIAADYKMPSMSAYGIGLGMVAPTILAHATDPVKDAYLRRMYRGDIVACSCSASHRQDRTWLRCRPELSATVMSRWSTARSEPQGNSCPISADHLPHRPRPSQAPGTDRFWWTPRPRGRGRTPTAMTGGASLNEVFFTDVRIPDSDRLGEVNGGWTVALTDPDERACRRRGRRGWARSADLDPADPACRPLGGWTIPWSPATRRRAHQRTGGRYTNLRAMAEIAVGRLPGPEMSLAKLC